MTPVIPAASWLAPPPSRIISEAVRSALDEDLGLAGDVTSAAVIAPDAMTEAIITSREEGVIAGVPLAAAAFAHSCRDIRVVVHTPDGLFVDAEQPLLTVAGPARAIMTAERTALNFLGHLSGIATLTERFVRRIAGTKARICCTRKTTPGLRALEKYAVRCGGGFNHRFGLDDAVLIKDNHIAIAGGVKPALENARKNIGHMLAIEIEVDTLEQLSEVLDLGLADSVLLDNMELETLRQAVIMTRGRVTLEASGGVTEDSVGDIAQTGVGYISAGALTHSAPSLDVALHVI